MTVTGEWRLAYDKRPWTINAERRWHPMVRARHVREWREAFAWQAKQARMPRPIRHPVIVTAHPYLCDRRAQDAGAAFGAVKAAIDGLVDAGVLAGDGPDHVAGILLLRPILGAESDALHIVVEIA